MSENIFETASKTALRFNTAMGSLTVEDLWSLALTKGQVNLDRIAIDLNQQIKSSTETESFVDKTKTVDKTLQLQFDIVKHIIEVRLDELEASKLAASQKQKMDRLLALVAEKEDQALAEKSVDELRALIDELKE